MKDNYNPVSGQVEPVESYDEENAYYQEDDKDNPPF